jgi:putative sigma-54 modulation protein
MQITVSGHQLELTPALRRHAEDKLGRLDHYEPLMDLHVVLHVEKKTHKAEATGHNHGRVFHCDAEADDLYCAIDRLADKLTTQLCRDKEKRTTHHGHGH